MAQHYKDLIAWQKAMDLVLIAQRRSYLSEAQAAELSKRADELSRILSGLINSLKERTDGT